MEAQATSYVVKTTSPQKTQKIAQKLAQSLEGGNVIAFFGDLGAGKTTFIQGLAKGLGIKKRIISPSFVFMRSYPFSKNGKALTFYHLDLYRGQKTQEFRTLGLEEIFSNDSLVVLEWAEKIKKVLPKKRIDVTIELINETTRRIKITLPPMSFPPSNLSFPPFTRHSRESGNPFRVNSRESKNWIPDPFGSTQGSPRKFTLKGKQVGNDKDINRAVEILKQGGVVIFPTDTVYGISCRFDDQKAINRIYQIKGSPKNQPFPILVSSIKQVERLAQVTNRAERLIKKYWPGGLTIVLPGLSTYFKPGLKQLHKPGLEHAKIGFRMPNSKLVLSLIEKVGVPMIGTSANFHGAKTPTSYQELDPVIIKLSDYIIKGQCKLGVESTVVDATADPPNVLRQGAVLLS